MKSKIKKGFLGEAYFFDRSLKNEYIFRYKSRALLAAEMMKKYCGSGRKLKILEIGAAEGLTLIEFNKLIGNSEIVGIEYSDELLKHALKFPANIKLLKGDAMNLPKEVGNDFDCVSALAVVEHLRSPQEMVKEAKRILKNGGILIITNPSPFWISVSSKLHLLNDEKDTDEIDQKKLLDLVARTGLRVVESGKFMWAPVSLSPYFKINISPSLALRFDRLIRCLRIFDWLFVNQYLVAVKG